MQSYVNHFYKKLGKYTVQYLQPYFNIYSSIFTAQTLVPGSLFNKVASPKAWRPLAVLETLAQVFLCEFCETFRKAFLQKTS